jgi:hypothetical protein
MRSRLIAKAAGGDQQRQRADRDRDHDRIPELAPEIIEEVMLLVEHDAEIVQGRMVGQSWPEKASSLGEIANRNMW